MANERLGPGAGASTRTRIRRHPERSAPELAEELLRTGRVAHVAFVAAGQPYVLPFTYHYDAGKLYIHGAPASRTLRHAAGWAGRLARRQEPLGELSERRHLW